MFNIKQLERAIEKAVPIKAFTLYEGCSFWCAIVTNDFAQKRI